MTFATLSKCELPNDIYQFNFFLSKRFKFNLMVNIIPNIVVVSGLMADHGVFYIPMDILNDK